MTTRAAIEAVERERDELRLDLHAMRIGREHDDLQWRKLWEKSEQRALAAESRAAKAEEKLRVAVEALKRICDLAGHADVMLARQEMGDVARSALEAIEKET